MEESELILWMWNLTIIKLRRLSKFTSTLFCRKIKPTNKGGIGEMVVKCVNGNNGNGNRVSVGNCNVFDIVKVIFGNKDQFFVVIKQCENITRLISIDEQTRGNYMIVMSNKKY